MPNFTVGLDLGQSRDFSALVVAERVHVIVPPSEDIPPLDAYTYGDRDVVDEYHVRFVQTWKLGTPYDVVVDDVAELMQTPAFRRRAVLCFDATGVGGAVSDLLSAAYRQGRLGDHWPKRFNLVAGFSSRALEKGGRSAGGGSVHKGDLVARLVRLHETGRIVVPPGLPGAEDLVKQLRAFKLKQNARTGNVTYEAARESDHDDLVIALALAVWLRHRHDEPRYLTPAGVLREKPEAVATNAS